MSVEVSIRGKNVGRAKMLPNRAWRTFQLAVARVSYNEEHLRDVHFVFHAYTTYAAEVGPEHR